MLAPLAPGGYHARAMSYPKGLRLSLLFPLALLAGACGHSIGDSCTTNVECSPTGDRICDTSQVDGYCTVEGCDVQSCPEEAVCIRFFPASFLSRTCNPFTEGVVGVDVTPTHACTSTEICLSSGLCAQRTSERRFCMLRCESDADCRNGYGCVRTGTGGAEALRDPAQASVGQQSFCAQKQ